jgi:hypothetical protein
MAISIGGTVVIDDSRNIVNVNDIRVGVVTITGSTGNIQTPGTITGAGYSVSGVGFTSFPGAGDTNVNPATTPSIILSFPTSVIRGTGTVTLRIAGVGGTIIESFNAATSSKITVLNNTWSVSTTPVGYSTAAAAPTLPFGQTIFLVIPSTAITGFVGLNTTGATTYSFATSGVTLGSVFEGGTLICRATGINWIAATIATEVSRNWYARTDANTRAQQVSGCTGWFVPSCQQFQNPGYTCRSFWQPYSGTRYWTNTEAVASIACIFNMGNGTSECNPSNYGGGNKSLGPYCVRSFRCVTY